MPASRVEYVTVRWPPESLITSGPSSFIRLLRWNPDLIYIHRTDNLAFTDAELLSLTRLGQLHPVSVNVLNPEFAFYRLYLHISTNDVGAYLANRSFVSIPAGLIVIRASVVASPIYYTRTLTRLDYNVTFALSQQFDRVYDSGSVLAFQTR